MDAHRYPPGMITSTRTPVLAALLGLSVLAAAGCGSDGDSSSTAATAPATVASDTEVAASDTAATATDAAPVEAMTGEQICERLPIQTVGAALGLDIGLAEADDSGTPQCAYEYTNKTGATSNLTVASMRPDDVGGLTGSAAYDFVLGINRQVAGTTDVEENSLDAGDGATRLSGASVHLGVLLVGDRVFTVIVPADDATGPDVDSLIAKMATTLA